MKRPATALSIILALCACTGTTSGPPAETTRATPTLTERATPSSTPATQTGGMPAEWADKVCLALNQLGEASEDIGEMGDAAAAGDVERMGLMAYAASGYATTVQVALMQAPEWEPGAAAVAGLTALTNDLVTGLEAIDAASQSGDQAALAEGNALVAGAASALTDLQPELARLHDEHGLACVLP